MPFLAAPAFIVAGTAVTWGTVIMAAVTAASAYMSYSASQKAKAAANAAKNQRDITTTVRSSVSPLRKVYGKSVGGGVLDFFEEEQSTSSTQRIILTVTTAGHRINKVTRIWFGERLAWNEGELRDDIRLSATSGKGYGKHNGELTSTPNVVKVSSSELWYASRSWESEGLGWQNTRTIHIKQRGDSDEKYQLFDIVSIEPLYEVGTYGGTTYAAGAYITLDRDIGLTGNIDIRVGGITHSIELCNDPKTIDDVPPMLFETEQWKDDMIGKNTHYIAIKINHESSVYANGLPTFKIEREGSLVYDPRKDTTKGGFGNHRVDNPDTWEWSANAALCILDALMTLYGWPEDELNWQLWIDAANDCDDTMVNGDKRYEINGEFEVNEKAQSILDEMLKCCAGRWSLNSGKLGLHVGKYNGAPSVSINQSMFTGTVAIVPESGYSERANVVSGTYVDPETMYQEASYPSADLGLSVTEGVLETPLDFRFVTNHLQAQRLAWIAVRKNRDRFQVSIEGSLDLMVLASGDNVNLDFEHLGISGIFQPESWGFDLNDKVSSSLVKDDETYYAEDFSYVEPSKGVRQVVEYTIPSPSGLSFVGSVDDENQGFLKWDAVSGNYSYSISIRKADENDNDVVLSGIVDEPLFVLSGLQAVESVATLSILDKSSGMTSNAIDLLFLPESPPLLRYTYFAYADDDQGNGFTFDPLDKAYLGTAANRVETTAPTDPSVYVWIKTEGKIGPIGATGPSGQDGALDDHTEQMVGQLERLPKDRRKQNLESILAGADMFKQSVRENESVKHRAYHMERIETLTGETSALAVKDVELGAQIGEAEARANEYTRAAVGYCIDANGNITSAETAAQCLITSDNTWVEGPLSESIRGLLVNTSDGSATISDIAQVFQDKDGNLTARGALLSNVNGKITGFVNNNDGSTTNFDIIADHFRVGKLNQSGDFIRQLWLDTDSGILNFNGKLILTDGTTINDESDIRARDGDYYEYQYSPDGISWHNAPMVAGDNYRRERLITPESVGSWSGATRLTGVDGDYYEYQYSTNNSSWHNPPMQSGDIYRRERLITESVIGSWSAGSKIAGIDGDDGNTIFEEYRYGPTTNTSTGWTAWGGAMRTGDIYRQERLVVNGVGGISTTPSRIAGADGADGDTYEEQYRYNSAASDTGATGWNADARDTDRYRQRRILKNGSLNYTGSWHRFSTDGDDGDTIFEEYRYNAVASDTGATAYGADMRASDYYRQRRTSVNGVIASTGAWHVFRKDGAKGDTGVRGAGRFQRAWAGLTDNLLWSHTEAVAACTGGVAQANDVVTLYNPNNPAIQATRIYDGSGSSTSDWQTFALQIHGNAIISGTLSVSQIVFDQAFGQNATFLGTVYAENLIGDVPEIYTRSFNFNAPQSDEEDDTVANDTLVLPEANFKRRIIILQQGVLWSGTDSQPDGNTYGDYYYNRVRYYFPNWVIGGITVVHARQNYAGFPLSEFHDSVTAYIPNRGAAEPIQLPSAISTGSIISHDIPANSSLADRTMTARRNFKMVRYNAANYRTAINMSTVMVLSYKI